MPVITNAMMDVQSECEVIPRDFLCCKICGDEYKQPKYLICLHSFCSTCIDKYIHDNGNGGVYWCPICGTESNANKEGTEKLPDNLLARRLSSPTMNNQCREKICTHCKNGGNFIDANVYCLNCDDFLCGECLTGHEEQNETSSHRTETVEAFEIRTDYEESAKTGNVLPRCCEYYDPLDIGAMFCVDCDTTVCGDCHLSYHEEHRCAEINAVADNFEKKIKSPLLELQNDAEALQEAIVELQKSEHAINNQEKDMYKVVKKRKKYLCDMIQEYENVLLDEIDKRHKKNITEIYQRRKEIQMHLAAIDGVNDFTEKLLSYGSFEEKVLMRKKVGKRVRELCEEPLLTDSLDLPKIKLNEPTISVESVCNMFGELTKGIRANQESTNEGYPPNVDSGNASDTMENNDHENNHQRHSSTESDPRQNSIESEPENLTSTGSSDFKMLSLSNNSDCLRNVKFRETVEETEYEAENCFTLDNPKREITLPSTIQHECLKGIGINSNGDIIIGASAANYQMIYLLEKRGIIRGQVPIQSGWNIHSVSSDGKIALTVARGDNRFKVRVLRNDGSGHLLTDTQIENYGLNFVTADNNGNLIVASSRYSHVTNFGKLTSKAGGNISIYGQNGILKRRITNEDYQDLGLYVLEKPHCIAMDTRQGNFYVADPGCHNVTGYDSSGELIFEYGSSDHDGQVYDGPDLVCVDNKGNVLVADKREGKVDVLSSKGELKKSLFTDDVIKFMSVTPDKLLMLATAEGAIKFYEYL